MDVNFSKIMLGRDAIGVANEMERLRKEATDANEPLVVEIDRYCLREHRRKMDLNDVKMCDVRYSPILHREADKVWIATDVGQLTIYEQPKDKGQVLYVIRYRIGPHSEWRIHTQHGNRPYTSREEANEAMERFNLDYVGLESVSIVPLGDPVANDG